MYLVNRRLSSYKLFYSCLHVLIIWCSTASPLSTQLCSCSPSDLCIWSPQVLPHHTVVMLPSLVSCSWCIKHSPTEVQNQTSTYLKVLITSSSAPRTLPAPLRPAALLAWSHHLSATEESLAYRVLRHWRVYKNEAVSTEDRKVIYTKITLKFYILQFFKFSVVFP